MKKLLGLFICMCAAMVLTIGTTGCQKAEKKPAVMPADKKPAADADKKPAADADKKPAADADKKPAADADKKPAADKDKKPAADADKKPAADADKKPAADKDKKDKTSLNIVHDALALSSSFLRQDYLSVPVMTNRNRLSA